MFPEETLKKLDRVLDMFIQEKIDTDLNNNKAFFWDGSRKVLKPVRYLPKVSLDDLRCIDYQKEKLIKNTEKFINNKPANHALLWGERGTGKSSLIKAVFKKYSNRNLRLIQVLKQDILSTLELFDFIYENQNYRFIIFIDDLSFDVNESDYRELKTIIEGSILDIPDNLLFYVTSNRKNLVPIRFSDRDTDEKNPEETIQEKLSLVERFGLQIPFYKFSKSEYLEIVDYLAEKYKISIEKEELHYLAMKWSREYGISGRTAHQFIKSL